MDSAYFSGHSGGKKIFPKFFFQNLDAFYRVPTGLL